MFLEFKHGGHSVTKSTSGQPIADPKSEDFDVDNMTRFHYLLDEVGAGDLLPVGDATVRALDKLGSAMVDQAQDTSPDSDNPPIYTYWSQFIDHELTARTDRDTTTSDITVDVPDLAPVDRHKVENGLFNRRTPALELDAVYGDGPPGNYGDKARVASGTTLQLAKNLRDGAKMRIGMNTVTNGPGGQPLGPVPPPANDLARDLPRIGALLDLGVVKPEEFPEHLRNSATFRQRAFVGDPRNDENLAVAQFHTAMLRFHNAVVDWLRFKNPHYDEQRQEELFEDARKIVRWTFQWLVVNDFLHTLARPDIVAKVLQDRARLYTRRSAMEHHRPFMPLEFSVACYRFGHSMIRNAYDFNRNFGRKPDDSPGFVIPAATLDLFFLFTGKSPTPFNSFAETLPHNWIVEWDRFDGSTPHAESNGEPARVARKIDTRLSPFLGDLSNEGNDKDSTKTPDEQNRISMLLKQLARRNLRRGYQLSLPTGQALARAVGAQALTPAELDQNASTAMNEALQEGGFLEHTPLWYYVLKEAEVREDGQRLGELGSRIVVETMIGVLLADPESYLARRPDWDPAQPTPGSGGPLQLKDGRTIKKIGDLLEFAGVKQPTA